MKTEPGLRKRLSMMAGLLICLVVSAVTLAAQTNKGTIVGTITDSTGAVISGAEVKAVNIATRIERGTVSSADGTYSIPALDPGEYRVTISANGFRGVVIEKVTLQTNDRLPVDVKMEVSSGVAESVTITADAPLVETESSVRGDVITGRQVTDLPLGQRNFTLLAGITPGITRPAVGVLGGGGNFSNGGPGNSTESTRFRESGGSVIAANGARVTNNNFTLDGVDNNETQFGQIAIFPDVDAIKEFKVEASVPSAESGRAGGAIISTTIKSGTNQIHGTLREFYQGRFGSARPTNNPNPPNYVTHNFGATIGGPIFLPKKVFGPTAYDGRDKSFWFVSYNGQRNGTPAFGGGEFPFVTVPTAKQRIGDFSEYLDPTRPTVFNTVRGPVTAPRGTIFDANGNPFAGNIIPSSLLSPAARAVMNAYPLPTEPGLINNFRRNRSERSNVDSYDIKIDQRITDNNLLFGRYSNSKNLRIRDNNFPIGSSPNGNDMPSGFGAGEEFGNTRQVALGDTHTFSPTVINDMRAGYSRVSIGINNPGINGALGFNPNVSANLGIPNINVCTTCEGIVLLGIVDQDQSLEFVGDGGPFYFRSNNFHFADTLTVVSGSHLFKFGGDFRLRQNTNFDGGRNGGIKGNVQYGTSTGGFVSGNYSGVLGLEDSGSAYANFLLGYSPGFITRGTPGGPYMLSNKEVAFFVQDDWKVTNDLTLNVGLRYDIYTSPTERYNRQANFDPATRNLVVAGDRGLGTDLVDTDMNNFAPRVGFAYSGLRPDKRLVIRGGYATVYTLDVSGRQPLTANPPNGANYSCVLANFGTANCPILPRRFNLDTGYPFAPEITAAGPTLPVPGGANVLFLRPNNKTAFFHQFNLTTQYEFATNWLGELAYVGSKGRNLLVVRNIGDDSTNGPGSREITGIGQVITTENTGISNYNALQAKLEKRFSGGLSILSTYTWAHGLDNSPGGFPGLSQGPNRYGYSNPLRPELDYASSDLDIRHRFTFTNTWNIPIGKGRKLGGSMPWAADMIVGGWQVNNVVTIQSGPVYTINFGGPRPDLIGDPTPTAAQKAQGFAVNPNAFRAPTTPIFANDPTGPKFGTLGRNTFRGERQEYWDLGLLKDFRLWETGTLQARVQAYNVLNHVNRFAPNQDITQNNGGIDTSLQRSRQLEFALRLIF
ncbi:MAG: TonB-dependent receptor [Blastocatellales bacterium]